MSVRRLAGTTVAMTAVAAVLVALAPDPPTAWAALRAPQQTVDAAGVDALLVPLAGGLAWLAWGWGALGLLLTAATGLPGAFGAAAAVAQRLLVPDTGRRAAALLLGIGMGLGAPTAAAAAPAGAGPAMPLSAADGVLPAPDWPAAPRAADPVAPDWPAAAAAHRVLPGDCLWTIAAAHLADRARPAGNAEIAAAVTAWWSSNRSVIGPDPDLIRPGQLLLPPDP